MSQASLGAEGLDPLLQSGAAEHRRHVGIGDVAGPPCSLERGAILAGVTAISGYGRGAGR
jgi:hypothetical protein